MNMNPQLPNKKMRGSALVLALMIVAVTSAIAYALIETSTFAVRRTTQINEVDTCRQAVRAAELYAIDLLYQEPGHDEMITDLEQNWAIPFEMQLQQEVGLQGQVSDLQGKMNINLMRAHTQAGVYTPELIFTRLLVALNIQDAQSVQQHVVHWLGAETTQDDQIYLQRNPAYRAAHAPLSSISELQLIEGITAERMALLAPFVSALPESENINVNTAPAEVLAALLDTSPSAARVLINERMAYPFKNTQEFINRAMAKAIAISDQGALGEMISVNSRYFLLKTVAMCRKTTLISYSFINRSAEGQASVYQRTQQL